MADPTNIEKAGEAAAHATGFLSATGWVGVAFVIFCALFIWKAWPMIAKSLDAKSKEIADKLAEAEKLKNEAQAMLAEVERKAAEAEQAKIDMLETAKADAKQMIVNAEKEIEKEISEKIALADEKIKRAEKLAIENVRHEAIDAAIKTAEGLISEKLKGAKKDALVKDSLKVISSNIK